MALNSSGPISLGGNITGQSTNIELGQSTSTQISLNDTVVRTLAGKASGVISFYDLYGKSSGIGGPYYGANFVVHSGPAHSVIFMVGNPVNRNNGKFYTGFGTLDTAGELITGPSAYGFGRTGEYPSLAWAGTVYNPWYGQTTNSYLYAGYSGPSVMYIASLNVDTRQINYRKTLTSPNSRAAPLLANGIIGEDAAGNSYVLATHSNTAYQYGYLIDNPNIIKLDSAGNVVWWREVPKVGYYATGFRGQYAPSIGDFTGCIDQSGNVYVAQGVSGGPLGQTLIFKLNTNGVLQWSKQFNSSYCSCIFATSTNVYFVSENNIDYSSSFVGKTDQLLTKLDTNGNTDWCQVLTPGDNYGGTGSITVDDSGNIYWLLGASWLIKYNSSGIKQWVTVVSAVTSSTRISTDKSGNIYILSWNNSGYGKHVPIVLEWTSIFKLKPDGSGTNLSELGVAITPWPDPYAFRLSTGYYGFNPTAWYTISFPGFRTNNGSDVSITVNAVTGYTVDSTTAVEVQTIPSTDWLYSKTQIGT
jgi:hypothetical protein